MIQLPVAGIKRSVSVSAVISAPTGWPASANGYPTLIVATCTSRQLAYSAAAYRLVAIRALPGPVDRERALRLADGRRVGKVTKAGAWWPRRAAR